MSKAGLKALKEAKSKQQNSLDKLLGDIQICSTIGNWVTNWSKQIGQTDCIIRAV
ncbi:hypothetical protein SAMN02745246_03598 [Leeuwenhoekiella marinoflava DSM 3653]|uniref:Uncharacterized protein n=2 Tax=Leeuwenhoekiella marinoflava TaxID=988 RepID=A0A4Q0PF35_9FLAO|nr:hypothetical protein DSL99_3488 [Leeuwenhoekiella marinoflava]SHF86555.1 hypothetical protein SAMN02745246_03598 [Leeuwenhoekiella marinoflava DSM 3653]